MELHKCCNKLPLYTQYQATEDTCEGYFKCPICGKESDPAVDVWGGKELRILAVDCWNEQFEIEEGAD